MKRIAVLGSTGSIGRSALAVVEHHADRLRVVGLAAGANVAAMAGQVAAHRPLIVSMAAATDADAVRTVLAGSCASTRFVSGREGLVEVATHDEVDLVLCASSGTEALEAVLAAIACGKTVALANKEVLVMAGHLVMEAARRHGALILPVDSEHNAIHQCLHGRSTDEVRRLVLTASGGPFRSRPAGTMAGISPEDALSHPTWKMGRKITIDSATLMNKGLEVIEAHWMFGLDADAIDVVIHPQSIVHSLVEFRDGSLLAQLGPTDMRLPIQYAFSYPERWDAPLPVLDLVAQGPLEFHPPDPARFPCLTHAYAALRAGGAFPVVLNAANEMAVGAFLDEGLPFPAIPQVIERALDAHVRRGAPQARSLAEVREIDAAARALSRELIRGVESRMQVRS
jgi:1-deoxy-D-xylulose-5-phosphate reductoisomerase